MLGARAYTLTDVSRLLAEPQHRLIHLCEKSVVDPDLHDAHGRGSSRLFSDRNLLEFAIALRLRAMNQPVIVAQAAIRVLRRFQGEVEKRIPGFELPEGLRGKTAPDLRLIISDGSTLFFQLGGKLFGGVALNRSAPTRGSVSKPTRASRSATFGGPEGSRYTRLELSITRIAQDLPLD